MNAVPTQRGTALLLAHCESFDPAAATARERLDEALGAELAARLVSALTAGAPARAESGLRPRAVFAA
jgi:hypothetical protein